ncbi:CPBP family glutamic-type intramembrane protease [Sharpea azabuensis]
MIFILIKNRWVALVLSRILFSLAHTINLMTITPYLVISLFMEIAYGRYGLSSATFIHMIYNALSVFI